MAFEPTAVEPTAVDPLAVKLTTVEPTAVNPTVVEASTVEPTAVDPAAAEPTVVDPTAVELTPVYPIVVEPTAVDLMAVEPTAVNATAVEPMAVNPAAAEVTTVNPTAVYPTAIDPAIAEPTVVDPTAVELTPVYSTVVEPTAVDLMAVEPTAVDPAAAEPTVVDPTAVELTPVYPTVVEPTAVDFMAVEPTAVNATAAYPMAVDPAAAEVTTVDPTAVELTAVYPTVVEPTAVDFMAVEPTAVNATAVDPMAVEATAVEPMAVNPMAVAVDGSDLHYVLSTVTDNIVANMISAELGPYFHMPCDVDSSCDPLLLVPLQAQSTPSPVITVSGTDTTAETVREHSSVIVETPVVSRMVPKTASRRLTTSNIVTRAKARCDPRSSVRKPKRRSASRTIPQRESDMHDIPSASEDSLLSASEDNDECTIVARQKATPVDSRAHSVVNAEPLKARLNWKDGGMNQEHATFAGLTDLNDELKQLSTPLQYFRYFFTDKIFGVIAEQTSLYAAQQSPESPANITVADIEAFVGICMFMSLIKMSNTRHYWSKQFRVDRIASIMNVNAFGKIKRFLHLNNNDLNNGTDRLHKLRPLLDMLRCQFKSVPLEEQLSIDEQMVPFKGHHGLKQYLPKKPHKWGYKIYVLSGVSGFACDTEVYSGKDDNILTEDETNVGASGNIVVRLARCIPSSQYFKLYFDNFFNSPALQIELARRGILCLGTVRPNRLSNCKVVGDSELKKQGRGAFAEKVARVDDNVQLSVVRWFDNHPVTFLSSFVGAQPVTNARRWDRSAKADKQIPCPQVVTIYNRHMGGVDLLDSLIGLYRCRIRSKKWYHRIFLHLCDLTVVNAWLLYKRVH